MAEWIDADLLEAPCDACRCALCFGIMALGNVPTSGCPDGHTFCKPCYDSALDQKKACPTCRYPTDKGRLVRMRPLEDMAEAAVRKLRGPVFQGRLKASVD